MTYDNLSADAVYREFHPKVTAYVRGRIANAHDAEELVSSVFFKIVQKLDSYDPSKASLSTWVYTITRNTVTDFFRTHRPTVALEDYMTDEAPVPDLSDAALESLADALLALKEKERDLVILHYYQGYTIKTAAELMGMSYINAKVIHRKALAGLRTYFAAG